MSWANGHRGTLRYRCDAVSQAESLPKAFTPTHELSEMPDYNMSIVNNRYHNC